MYTTSSGTGGDQSRQYIGCALERSENNSNKIPLPEHKQGIADDLDGFNASCNGYIAPDKYSTLVASEKHKRMSAYVIRASPS